MSAYLEIHYSQSFLYTEAISDDLCNITLSAILAATKNMNSTMEKRFTEMEKRLIDSMLKACEAKLGQDKDEFHSKITKLRDRLVTIENLDRIQFNGQSSPCKINFTVRNMNERNSENVKKWVNGMIKELAAHQ